MGSSSRLEGVAEAVVERGAQRAVAALLRVHVVDVLLAVADGLDEGRDLLPGAQALAHGLAGDDAQGERVAGAVVEQRLPVRRLWRGRARARAPISDGQGGGVGAAHARHGDAVGHAAQPALLVAAAGEQDLGLGGPVQLDLLEEVGQFGLLRRGPGDSLPAGKPATGSTLSQIQSTGIWRRICRTRLRRAAGVVQGVPLDVVGLQQRGEDLRRSG